MQGEFGDIRRQVRATGEPRGEAGDVQRESQDDLLWKGYQGYRRTGEEEAMVYRPDKGRALEGGVAGPC